MQRNFQDNDIIRFLYDEMDRPESDAFLDALMQDEELWERYEHFQQVVEGVSQVKEEPKAASVAKVMAFVAATAGEPVAQPKQSWPDRLKLGKNWLPISINLNAVVVMALLLFISIGVTGSFLKLKRAHIGKPSSESLVHQVESLDEPLFEWDDSGLDQELDDIRARLEGLQSEGDPIL
ncbi:MAG: hypothetical protein AAFR61_25125 [Bacteroidota bacterium]